MAVKRTPRGAKKKSKTNSAVMMLAGLIFLGIIVAVVMYIFREKIAIEVKHHSLIEDDESRYIIRENTMQSKDTTKQRDRADVKVQEYKNNDRKYLDDIINKD
jgi:hypothetical protein